MKKSRKRPAEKPKDKPGKAWERENFYLWMFIAKEGLFEDARDFLEEYAGPGILAGQAP